MIAKGPTLTDRKGLGGIIAQSGFDYQVWDALIRLPSWLHTPAFEGFAVEVLEDFEARFFAPRAPRSHVLDRFQAKSGTLAPPDVARVFTSFKDFDEANPGVARVQTLVTPSLPPTLAWIGRDPGRVRRARPFYRPFPDILTASDDKLRTDLIADLGQELGQFVAGGVEVALRNWPDRASAEAAFAAALHDTFPDLEIPVGKLRQAFAALSDLVNTSRGIILTRRRLLDVLAGTLGFALITDERLRLHVRSDNSAEVTEALEIDASRFCGVDGTYPESGRWRAELMDPLEKAARWAREQGYRRIALSGSYRLSTALGLGWAFRSAAGFELDVPTKSGPWATDSHPAPGEVPPWAVSLPQRLAGNRLVVGIGVLRNPVADVVRSVTGASEEHVLLATLTRPLTSAVEAQASAQVIKTAVADAVAYFRPTGIDLFYIGPAIFAVALGHRWNGLPPTQAWEFLRTDGRYTPTALLG
jgi:hypothetical protein